MGSPGEGGGLIGVGRVGFQTRVLKYTWHLPPNKKVPQPALHSMLEKQLTNLGAPNTSAPHGSANKLYISFYASDGGSDQMAYKRAQKVISMEWMYDIHIGTNCMMHPYQLVYKDGLLVVDDWLIRKGQPFKYFSALAKIFHIWRDECRNFFHAWVRHHGALSALKHAIKLPQKAIAIRWGSTSSCEQRLESMGGRTTFAPVFLDVVEKRHVADTAMLNSEAPEPIADTDVLTEENSIASQAA